MALAPGTHLGPYEILSPLGAGGMGEVYRARDTRLDRDVAIKILPAHLSSDATRKQRFEREAKTISSLNHPHICTLHDIGSQDGVDFLVMECVEGETLAKRLEKGALPLEQVLKYGAQIADALDKAHRAGIVHRDLKPGNIMLTVTGAKLLDFGLAKPAAPLVSGVTLTAATTPVTQEGTIVGTFQYMSPEQVEGKELDGRSDIFSLGTVLYEMLTGKKAFEGKSQLSVASAILEKEPIPIHSLKPMTPPMLDHIVKKCLAKLPEERWQSASDLASELIWIAETRLQVEVSPASVQHRIKPRIVVAAMAACTLVASALTWWLARPGPSPNRVARATVTLPTKFPFALTGRWTATNLAISPQGTRLVYVGTLGGVSQLYLRPVDRLEVAPVPGTEGALNPFFSPDGNWIGYFADGKLKKVQVDGGEPITICNAEFGFGGAWSDDNEIVFAGGLSGGLSRVSANGGEPKPLTKLYKGELVHRWPAIVPGSHDVLFAVASEVTSWGGARIAVQSLDSAEHHIVLDGGTSPKYLPTGHILFARDGLLLAVPVDRSRWAANGQPVEVLQGVTMSGAGGQAQYALSANGTLVFLPGGEEDLRRTLYWVDRRGSATALGVPPHGYERPRISPDGQKVALTIRETDADIWVLSLKSGTLTRLTKQLGEDESPVWSPDGKRVTYSSTRGDARLTLSRSADGSNDEEGLFTADSHQHLVGWMPDGRTLLTDEHEPGDLFERRLGEKTQKSMYLHTPFYKRGAQLSPDGRWVAYAADESGRNEVYVQGAQGGRWRISSEGGTTPMWARSGRELFYRNEDKMMAVGIQTQPEFRAGTSHILFEGQYAHIFWGESDYDVSPDGQRFLMVKGETPPQTTGLEVVFNWLDEFNRRVPGR